MMHPVGLADFLSQYADCFGPATSLPSIMDTWLDTIPLGLVQDIYHMKKFPRFLYEDCLCFAIN